MGSEHGVKAGRPNSEPVRGGAQGDGPRPVCVVGGSEPPRNTRSQKARGVMQWLEKVGTPVTAGLACAVIGWLASDVVSTAVLKDQFTRHEQSYGHQGVSDDMRETTRILEGLVVEVRNLGGRQLESSAELKSLVRDQREDMREVRRALRIPER